jgi:hypothetical protein
MLIVKEAGFGKYFVLFLGVSASYMLSGCGTEKEMGEQMPKDP